MAKRARKYHRSKDTNERIGAGVRAFWKRMREARAIVARQQADAIIAKHPSLAEGDPQ